MDSRDNTKLIYWLIECDVIAGSASYVVNGYPEAQVTALRDRLRAAEAKGFDWKSIYESIYKSWHSRRPHFPTPKGDGYAHETKPAEPLIDPVPNVREVGCRDG